MMFNKKGSIEFTGRQIIMLILMIIIAAIVIFLGIFYIDQVKEFFVDLLGGAETFAPGA
jgi:hypothetical protein